jgi:hypothetical protein
MKLSLTRLVLGLAVFCLLTLPALADALPAEGCDPGFTVCVAIEGQTLNFPGLAISGDALLIDGGGNTDGVFRIFNDVIDTGGGTGLGITATLFGATTGLPDPSTYSFNAIDLVFGADNGTGNPLLNVPGFVETEYIGNGTRYELFSNVPEPATWSLLGITLLLLGGARGFRRRTDQLGA